MLAEHADEMFPTEDTNKVDLADYKINGAAVTALPEMFARRYNVVPVDIDGEELTVAVEDTANVVILDDLHMITGFQIRTVVAGKKDILTLINRLYKASEAVQNEASSFRTDEVDDRIGNLRAVSEEAPVIKLVNMIINKAVNERASDIHIEPHERDLRIRYRVDGVLHEVMRSPKHVQAGLISRIKVMAGLNIAENRIPQDGHCDLSVGGKVIDFRVATLPTILLV